ncbi:MAG: tetratricopeptide repeat protein [Rubrivivax sp.]
MASPDRRGNPCSSGSEAARAAAERSLWCLLSHYGSPPAELEAAAAADPRWMLPHVMQAGHRLGLAEPGLVGEALAHLQQAQALAAGAAPRERMHLEAVQHVAQGRWRDACRLWDALLLEHPRDALALQWAHLWDFHQGDAVALQQRPARVLPEWDENDPLQPCVRALYALGLAECNLYAQAEDVGRRALAANPRLPTAVHAVAHVMAMQGRFDEGSAWLRQHQPQWAEGNALACHLWWHQALFRLEALDSVGVMRLLDHHLGGEALCGGMQRIDAAALLWRLHLLGEDVATRCRALLAGWPLPADAAGCHAIVDLHVVLALLGAGDVAAAERRVARCAERALAPADLRRSNHGVAREVGLPLMRGLLAFARGDARAACEAIYAVRALVPRLGGSQAQRELIDQTLLAAAARSGQRALGRALVNERRMAAPLSPLARHWIERLGGGEQARA